MTDNNRLAGFVFWVFSVPQERWQTRSGLKRKKREAVFSLEGLGYFPTSE